MTGLMLVELSETNFDLVRSYLRKLSVVDIRGRPLKGK
jgi:hypothetical protein